MSFWEKAYGELTGGAEKILQAYTEVEKAKASSYQAAQSEQVAARYTPEVEYQNRGEPVSVKVATPERDLVGDTPKNAAVIDKKWLYIGGGALILVAVVGLALSRR